ncbi:hypothetical protein C1H46_015181 [Malus baccata]|uniref:Uncharacterized protein n=1 Tax=Malus baccata TaxID=106549 RepID=A0A540MK58_MALBA|nr:hypothetical protein C1H46_015181 [Malus baccata]
MKTASSTSQEKKTTRLPPRRGKIKAEVFENIVKALVIMASKPAGREKNREEGGGNSASTTPPPTAYNSDANSDI